MQLSVSNLTFYAHTHTHTHSFQIYQAWTQKLDHFGGRLGTTTQRERYVPYEVNSDTTVSLTQTSSSHWYLRCIVWASCPVSMAYSTQGKARYNHVTDIKSREKLVCMGNLVVKAASWWMECPWDSRLSLAAFQWCELPGAHLCSPCAAWDLCYCSPTVLSLCDNSQAMKSTSSGSPQNVFHSITIARGGELANEASYDDWRQEHSIL